MLQYIIKWYSLHNNARINRYLPGVKAANTIGNQVKAMHDIDIFFAKQSYVVCFMSSGIIENTACEVIGQASKMIYDFVKANKYAKFLQYN